MGTSKYCLDHFSLQGLLKKQKSINPANRQAGAKVSKQISKDRKGMSYSNLTYRPLLILSELCG
jgi:hypothetical protein